jgi:hypothetical protein
MTQVWTLRQEREKPILGDIEAEIDRTAAAIQSVPVALANTIPDGSSTKSVRPLCRTGRVLVAEGS